MRGLRYAVHRYELRRQFYDSTRRAAAYHEAEHAVFACRYRFALRKVEIIPQAPSLTPDLDADERTLRELLHSGPPGCTIIDWVPRERTAGGRIREFIMYALAGRSAEERAFSFACGVDSDTPRAQELADRLVGRDVSARDALVAVLVRETALVVEQAW